MDCSDFQQVWGFSMPAFVRPSHLVTQHDDKPEGLSLIDTNWYNYDWNNVKCNQNVKNVPNRVVSPYNPELYSNSELYLNPEPYSNPKHYSSSEPYSNLYSNSEPCSNPEPHSHPEPFLNLEPDSNPKPYSNPEPLFGLVRHCRAISAASAAFSNFGQSPGVDTHQSFHSKPIAEPDSIPVLYDDTNIKLFSGFTPDTADVSLIIKRFGQLHPDLRHQSARCIRCWILRKSVLLFIQ